MYMHQVFSHKTFYAIGQGGFFSEVLQMDNEEVVIVYDCGSVDSGTRIETEIKKFPYKTIDYLVISHLDDDHVNYIDTLKKQRTINHVVLPKIDYLDRAFFFGKFCETDKILNTYFNTILSSNIIEISSQNQEDNEDSIIIEDNREYSPISHNRSLGTLNLKNKKGESKIPLWLLKFYVDPARYHGKNGEDKLDDDEKKLIDSIDSVKELKKHLDELKKIYEKIRGRMNGSSMAMVSAPNLRLHPYHYFLDEYALNTDFGHRNYATWMNGDIILKKEDEVKRIVQHYKEFFPLRFDYQLQHHGSHHNFCRAITEFSEMEIYVYYGYDNSYGHPSGTVLRKLKNDKIKIHDLTENDENVQRHCLWLFRFLDKGEFD